MKSKLDKQKGLLQIGGVFVFLTVVALFFIIGDGFGGDSEVAEERASVGLNTDLPDPDDVYASRGKLEAVRKEQSRVDMEKNRRLAQNSSFDMLNSLNAPKSEEVEPVDVDKLLGEPEAIEQPEPEPEVVSSSEPDKPSVKIYSSSRSSSAKPAQFPQKNSDDEERAALRLASAKRRVDRHIGTHEDSLLLGLVKDRVADEPSAVPGGGFNGIGASGQFLNRNKISAVIHGEQRNVRTSSQVKLRLMDPVVINGVVIPKNTFVVGTVSFGENRVEITTEKIRYNGELFPFNGTIYDVDGMKGLYAGDNLLNDMARKSGEGAMSESDYNRKTPVGIVSRVGRTVADETKKVVEKRQRLEKVDLPANYGVYILVR